MRDPWDEEIEERARKLKELANDIQMKNAADKLHREEMARVKLEQQAQKKTIADYRSITMTPSHALDASIYATGINRSQVLVSSDTIGFDLSLQEEQERREYLEKTQSMRVVALDEANKLVQATIPHAATHGLSFGPDVVVQTARVFADFLIDGKMP